MRNITITYSLLALVLILFILYFILQSILFPGGQPIANYLEDIVKYAQQEKWSEAEVTLNQLLSNWNKSKYFFSINYSEADFSLFLDNLARIQGAIKTRDKTETVSQCLASLKLWDNFIKVIPEP